VYILNQRKTGVYGALFACAALMSGCGGGASSGAGSIPSATVPTLKGPVATVPQAVVPVSTASPGTFTYKVSGLAGGGFMAVGPDRIYYSGTGGIGAVTYDGLKQTGVAVPDGSVPAGLTEGVNGAIYYAGSSEHLAEFEPTGTTQGNFTLWNDFGVTSAGTNSVASDPNGALWFAEHNNNSVVAMTTWGSLLFRTTLASGSQPWHLAVGADRASMWVTERLGNKIAKLSLSGALVGEYAIPAGCGSAPNDIALGGDGNMYFSEDVANSVYAFIGQVTPSGTITCVQDPNIGDSTGIAEGPDGNIWILEHYANGLVKFNLSTQTFGSVYSTYAQGVGSGQVMALGADGELWFITSSNYMVAFKPN
jgi:streptogramin lyase